MTSSTYNQTNTKPTRERAEPNIRKNVSVLGNVTYVPEFKTRGWDRVVGGERPAYRTVTGHGHAKLEDARAELAEMRAYYKRLQEEFENDYHIDGHMYFGVAFDVWSRKHRTTGYEDSTIAEYGRTSQLIHKWFAHLRVDQVTFEDLDDFGHANQHGSVEKGSKIYKHLNKMDQFFRYMVTNRYIQFNPFGDKDYMRQIFGTNTQRRKQTVEAGYGKPQPFLDPKSRRFMLKYLREEIKWNTMRVDQQVSLIAILIAATTGLRQAEIQALLPSDMLKSDRGTRLSVTKQYHEGSSVKIVPYAKNVSYRKSPAMEPWAADIIEKFIARRDKYLKDKGLYFENLPIIMSLNDHTHMVNQTPNTQKSNNLRLAKLLYAAGFDRDFSQRFTMHNWRHSLVTAYAYAGKLPKDVAPLMGHTVQTMLQNYDKAWQKGVDDAAYAFV